MKGENYTPASGMGNNFCNVLKICVHNKLRNKYYCANDYFDTILWNSRLNHDCKDAVSSYTEAEAKDTGLNAQLTLQCASIIPKVFSKLTYAFDICVTFQKKFKCTSFDYRRYFMHKYWVFFIDLAVYIKSFLAIYCPWLQTYQICFASL